MLSFTEFRSWMSPLCVGCGGQAVAKVGNKAGTGSSNPQFPNSPCPVLTRPPVKPTSPAELQKLSFKLVKSLIIQSNVYTDCYYRLVRQTWSAGHTLPVIMAVLVLQSWRESDKFYKQPRETTNICYSPPALTFTSGWTA